MTRIEVNHRAGLGSIFSILFSQLAKLPPDEKASLFATSSHYAKPDENIFEWYFENSPLEDGAVLWSNPPLDAESYPFNTLLGYDKARLAKLRQLRNRFFHPKPELLNKAKGFVRDRRALGVHYRGTDKYTEVPRIQREQVLAKVARIIRIGHDDIFIATDEESSADWFRAHIPTAWLNPHQRTNDANGLHITQGSRQQADEAILDIFCLSLCDTLLVGRGNFSDMACIFGTTDDIHYVETA